MMALGKITVRIHRLMASWRIKLEPAGYEKELSYSPEFLLICYKQEKGNTPAKRAVTGSCPLCRQQQTHVTHTANGEP